MGYATMDYDAGRRDEMARQRDDARGWPPYPEPCAFCGAEMDDDRCPECEGPEMPDDECDCVLPSQSCPVCHEAAQAVYRMEEVGL